MRKKFENMDIEEILNCLKVGVYITDEKGNLLIVNDESCKASNLTREEMVGKNMRYFEDSGYVKESITMKVVASRKEESMYQDQGDSAKVFVSAMPLFKDGVFKNIVCTEIDITETANLRNLLKMWEEKTLKYESEIEYLRNEQIETSEDLIAESDAMKEILSRVMKIASRDATVLLTGKSGTGKEVIANLIYKNSDRKNEPFIKINCAAIPENLLEAEFFGYEKGAFTGADSKGKKGLFEIANGGVIFLDEIGDLAIHMQSKLLRVLQEKEFIRLGGTEVIKSDVRIIAATNSDLKSLIEKGRFREDLYYRLSVIPIEIPPLNLRKEDIVGLANHFIKTYSKDYKTNKTLTKDALEVLRDYSWPGNVRELKNIIERLVVSFDDSVITDKQVKAALNRGSSSSIISMEDGDKSLAELINEYEKNILLKMLDKYGTSKTVAEKLGMNTSTLCRRLKKYDINH